MLKVYPHPGEYSLARFIISKRYEIGAQFVRKVNSKSNGAMAEGPSYSQVTLCFHVFEITSRYDTRYYFNVRSKADISQLNLPHGNNN